MLPKGWVDALRQVGLFVGAYVLYQVVRGMVNGNDAPGRASWNATKIINFERGLHVFVEPQIQQWALGFHRLMEFGDVVLRQWQLRDHRWRAAVDLRAP